MNSLFRIFDAFCAEFLGQKARANPAPKADPSSLQSTQVAMVSESSGREKEEMKAARRHEKERTWRRGLRFAPELDGLNCFETVVFH